MRKGKGPDPDPYLWPRIQIRIPNTGKMHFDYYSEEVAFGWNCDIILICLGNSWFGPGDAGQYDD
jgi:hypothetical protein